MLRDQDCGCINETFGGLFFHGALVEHLRLFEFHDELCVQHVRVYLTFMLRLTSAGFKCVELTKNLRQCDLRVAKQAHRKSTETFLRLCAEESDATLRCRIRSL